MESKSSSEAVQRSIEHENPTQEVEEIIGMALESKDQFLECQLHEQCSQYQLQTANDISNKIEALRYVLENDILACDAKWTLFVAAALSYRYDFKLKPFPPQYVDEQSGYKIGALVSVINDTPKLQIVLQNIVEQNYQEFSTEVIKLLYWVLITMSEPKLRLVDGEELNALLGSIDEKFNLVKPTNVFEVNAKRGLHSDIAFQDQVSNLPVKVAFMGNKIDSYFSLIYNGFVQQYAKYVELTTDLQTSLTHSPYGAAWGASECGSIIACTAICEFAYDTTTDEIISNKNDPSCINVRIKDPQNIRLRYLLFYGCRFPKQVLPKRSFLSWIYSHKYSLSLISYMLMLITIGVANSGNDFSLKMYMSSQFQRILDFCEGMFVTLWK